MKFYKFSRSGGLLLSALLCLAWERSVPAEAQGKEKGVSAEARPSGASERENPVKATPDNLAEAKKFFGYECAMCHDASGDGKGDLVASMGLKLKDWRESSAFAEMSDAELFEIIAKGKGKMVGEGDRASSDMVWKLVNYVRSLAKKETAAVPKTGH
jgi:hypothetical protein